MPLTLSRVGMTWHPSAKIIPVQSKCLKKSNRKNRFLEHSLQRVLTFATLELAWRYFVKVMHVGNSASCADEGVMLTDSDSKDGIQIQRNWYNARDARGGGLFSLSKVASCSLMLLPCACIGDTSPGHVQKCMLMRLTAVLPSQRE